MVLRKSLILTSMLLATLLFTSSQVLASNINLNSGEWLGGMKLDAAQMKQIKSAVEKALKAPIDAEQQCGKERLDCVVRAAREWNYEGEKYREIVIHIHTVGHASRAVHQVKGSWPKVVVK